MGRWGSGLLESDLAQDWLEEFCEDATPSELAKPAREILKSKESPDLLLCESCFGAAMVFLYLSGTRTPGLPAEVRNVLKKKAARLSGATGRNLAKALVRIVTESEARDLAEEANGLKGWERQIKRLIGKINAVCQ